MADDLDSPPLWRQHHVLWAAFGISVASAILAILLGVIIAFQPDLPFADDYRDQVPFFEPRLARSIAASLPAAGLIGCCMGAMVLRNKLYLASLLIVTGAGMFAVLTYFQFVLIPLALWAVYKLRRKCWEGNHLAILSAPIIHLGIGMAVFDCMLSFRPSNLHNKIGVAVAFSLLVSDCLIVALIGHLYRTRRMAEFDLGFRISLSTFMAIVLTAATYVTLLVSFFQ